MRTYQTTLRYNQRRFVSAPSSCANCRESKTLQYDLKGNVTSRKDFNNNETVYSYDTVRSLELSHTEAYGTPEARTITTDWHATYRLPTLIAEPGRSIAFSHDTSGNVLTRTETDTATSATRTWSFTYNGVGQVLTADGPRTDVSDVTTFTYYSCSTGNECGQLETVTNALGHQTTFDSYDAHGRVLEMTDPNGLVTTYTYDLRGRVTSVTQTPPAGAARVTLYAYDAAGQLETVTYQTGLELSYDYNDAHYLLAVSDNLGNRIEYGYDLAGNRTSESVKDPSGVLKRSVTTTYDTLGRIDTINAAGSITELDWDAEGNLIQEKDPNQNVTTHSYDPLNRLKQTLDALSGTTSYAYNPRDELVEVVAPNGADTDYLYNGFGDLTQLASPDTGVTVYGYDAAGNRTSQSDARGVTVAYSYDALNRLSLIDYPGTALDQSFSYDAGAGQQGRLSGIVDASGITSLGYDAFGNLVSESRVIDGVSYQTGYGYDAADQLTSIDYPSGRRVSYVRNVLGQVTAVTTTVGGTTTTVASGFSYLPFGPIAGYTLGNGLAVSRSHDQQYRITALASPGVQDLSYTLDAAGNIDAITDNLDSAYSQSFSQDALHRIDSETGAYGSKGYGYNAVGNRLTRTWSQGPAQTLSYVGNSNRMASQDGSAVVLDAAGNTLADGTGRTFDYDETNRMVRAYVGGNLVGTYTYHASGQRVKKVEAQGAQQKTIFHYGLGGELLGETVYSSTGVKEIEREFVWLNSLPLAQAERAYDSQGQVTSETAVHLHPDHLDTPRSASDDTGTIVWRWRGDSFGIGDAEVDPDGDLINRTVYLRFPGQYLDSETGLHYNYFRDYEPAIGRYTQADPIGLDGGLNPYLYADDNPLRYVDPEGLAATLPVSVAAGRACLSNGLCAGTVGAATGVALTCLINPDLCQTAVDLACEDISQSFDDLLKPFLNEDKRLTPGEIKKLKGAGIDPEDLKGGRGTGKLDLFKDRKGNIVIKPKDGSGPGEPTGININDL